MNLKDTILKVILWIGTIIGIGLLILSMLADIGFYFTMTIVILLLFFFIGGISFRNRMLLQRKREWKIKQKQKQEASFFHELTHHKERMFSKITHFIAWKEQSNCDFVEAFEQLDAISSEENQSKNYQTNY